MLRSPISIASISLGVVGGLVSVFSSSDGLAVTLITKCASSKAYSETGLGFPPTTFLWCLLTSFVRGFFTPQWSIGIFFIVFSLALQVWTYLAVFTSAHPVPHAFRPFAIHALALFSQIIGFQGVMTLYWVPHFAENVAFFTQQKNVVKLRENSARRVGLTVMGYTILGFFGIMFNPDHAIYQWSQVPFQFYPIASPLVYYIFVRPSKQRAEHEEWKRTASVQRTVNVSSAALWWIGLLYMFVKPIDTDVDAAVDEVLNPSVIRLPRTFPHWAWQRQPRYSDLSSGQLFCVFDILLMTIVFAMLYVIDRQGRHFKSQSPFQSLLTLCIGGPGYVWGRYFEQVLSSERVTQLTPLG